MTDTITQRGVQIIDDNARTVSTGGMVLSNTITFSGDDATVATPIFTVTGVVKILGLYGIVITQFGANHTDAHFRINDQTASDVVITKATTLDLNDISPGAMIIKNLLAAEVATYKSADAATMLEPVTAQLEVCSPFMIVQKTGDIQTDIEYVYTTTDDPTSGSMQFFVNWIPVSQDGNVAIA